ncbi:MAG: hypothetical protein ACEPOV_10180 [Hyphomicrobiales bacterium]
MKLQISTLIQGNYMDIYKAFDKNLFNFLNPIKSLVTVKKFEGTSTGNRFHLKFPLSQDWKGIITETKETDNYCYFTDEGLNLPFGLIQWRHRHWIIRLDDNESSITEDISFKCSSIFLNAIMYPFFWAVMYFRRFYYKRYFK